MIPVGVNFGDEEEYILKGLSSRTYIINCDGGKRGVNCMALCTKLMNKADETLSKLNRGLINKLFNRKQVFLSRYFDFSEFDKGMIRIINILHSIGCKKEKIYLNIDSIIRVSGKEFQIIEVRVVKHDDYSKGSQLSNIIGNVVDKVFVENIGDTVKFLTSGKFYGVKVGFHWKNKDLVIVHNGETRFFENVELDELYNVLSIFFKNSG